MPTLADYPHLVAQIDPENGPIAPETIPHGSSRRLSWRCPAGPDHRWSVSVSNRTHNGGSGCPFCAGRRVSVTNALSTVAPALALEWHPTKNGTLRPRDVVAGSHRAVWWKCPEGPDHEWTAHLDARLEGHGCPFCSGRRPSAEYNLAAASPALARQWHPTKNGDLRPEDVLPGSNRKVWWRCPDGHEWSAKPNDRTKGNGCPFCRGLRVAPDRSFAARFPAMARQWHPTKNGELTPADVMPAANRLVWWKCPEGPDHEWRTTVASRGHQGTGCPFCAGQRVSVTNSLASRFPEIAAEWHPAKNGDLGPADVVAGANGHAWWRCPSGHEWQATVNSRTCIGAGCPFCANQRVSDTNSLGALYPKLAREWHPTKNGNVWPGDVVAHTNRRAWWRCVFGHEWEARVSARSSQGSGCPVCWALSRKRPMAVRGRRHAPVRFAVYEGRRYGPVRRVR